jgi:hypothetical protein
MNDREIFGQVTTLESAGAEIRESYGKGRPMQQVKTRFTTAVAVQEPRSIAKVERRLLEEAQLAGEDFYYGWAAGKDRIEGPSEALAFAAARCWGNCAVECVEVRDDGDSWVITSAFVDLETGFTIDRPFRQSKQWVVHGRLDEERKTDVRFEIGATKSARNVILKGIPRWLIDRAMEKAKAGVRSRIEEYIKKNGIAAAQTIVIKELAKYGVKESDVLARTDRSAVGGLTVEDIVILKGDLAALQSGAERAEVLFPSMAAKTTTTAKEMMESPESQLPIVEAEDVSQDVPEPDPEAKKAPKAGKPKAEKYGEDSPAWPAFQEQLERVGNNMALAAKEHLGWMNTPFAKLRTEQLIELTSALKTVVV